MSAEPASAATPTSSGSESTTSNRWFSLIAPTSSQLTQAKDSAIGRVVIASGWDVDEPSNGGFSSSVDAQVVSAIATARAEGYAVVLDLGLQYPPSWVFSLAGQTRFVDQYGDLWHGSQSQDVPNVVFDSAVRSAEASYIAHLGTVLANSGVVGVRVGGLLDGELRYPSATYLVHSDLIWDYDPVAQAAAPVPGWKPGRGTAAQASASMAYYYAALTNYESWLMSNVNAAFPGTEEQVMFPSWGLRPGMTEAAIAGGFNGTTNAEVNGMISGGLDWANQVKAIATSGLNAVVYSTWVDAASQGTTVQQIPPIDYLTQLAAQYGLPVAGENTGGGGAAALSTTMARAVADNLVGVTYMSGALISNGSAGVTLQQVMTAASQ